MPDVDRWNKSAAIAQWITVVLALFTIWQTWPKSEGASPLRTWLIPAALIAALLLAATLHLAAAIIAGRKRSVRTTQQSCPDTGLHDIANEQAKEIHRFLLIERCVIGRSELFGRSDPFVEFMLTIHNASVFDVTLGEPRGSISFGGRELTGDAVWVDQVMPLHSNVGVITFRQKLDERDVSHLLNGEPHDTFDFARLVLPVHGVLPQVVEQLLNLHHRVTNGALLEKYPKLNIKIKQARLTPHYNFDEKSTEDKVTGSLVTLEIEFRNPRSSRLEIKDFKLDTSPHIERITPALSGLIYRKVWIEAGRLENRDRLTPNLKDDVPIEAEHEEPIEGWIQFYLGKVKPVNLDGRVFSLMIVDDIGVKHVIGTPVLKTTWPDIHAV